MKTDNRRKLILGAILRQERKSRGISQETLGQKAGVGKTTISAYELGKISPDIETLDKMCSYMSLDYIDVLRQAQSMYRSLLRAEAYTREVDNYKKYQELVVSVLSAISDKSEPSTAEPTVSAAQ